MATQDDDLLPLLRARSGALDPHVDRVRRVLWQAFQRGELTQEQLAQTLGCLEPEQEFVAPRHQRAQEEQRRQPGSRSRAEEQMDRLAEAVDQVGIGSGVDRGGTGSYPDHRHPRDPLHRVRIRAHGEVVVGVLADELQADQALGLLRQAGFGPGQLGLAVCCGTLVRTAGPLAGRADTGPFEALLALGIPATEASTCQQAFEACHAIVAVRAGARVHEGLALLHAAAEPRRAPVVIDPHPIEPQPADRPDSQPARQGGVGKRPARASARERRQHGP
jgi:hypothetical protein